MTFCTRSTMMMIEKRIRKISIIRYFIKIVCLLYIFSSFYCVILYNIYIYLANDYGYGNNGFMMLMIMIIIIIIILSLLWWSISLNTFIHIYGLKIFFFLSLLDIFNYYFDHHHHLLYCKIVYDDDDDDVITTFKVFA